VTEEKTREQRVNVGSEDEGEEKTGRRGPQKKFKWNKEIRSEQENTWLTQWHVDGTSRVNCLTPIPGWPHPKRLPFWIQKTKGGN